MFDDASTNAVGFGVCCVLKAGPDLRVKVPSG
jgi:hypothetical protein